MTGLERVSFAVALCALTTFAGGAFAQAKMPQGQFMCQVEDADGVTRFIGIQAATLRDAQHIVQGKSKWAVPAGRELVECIEPDKQSFKSRKAQKQYTQDVR